MSQHFLSRFLGGSSASQAANPDRMPALVLILSLSIAFLALVLACLAVWKDNSRAVASELPKIPEKKNEEKDKAAQSSQGEPTQIVEPSSVGASKEQSAEDRKDQNKIESKKVDGPADAEAKPANPEIPKESISAKRERLFVLVALDPANWKSRIDEIKKKTSDCNNIWKGKAVDIKDIGLWDQDRPKDWPTLKKKIDESKANVDRFVLITSTDFGAPPQNSQADHSVDVIVLSPDNKLPNIASWQEWVKNGFVIPVTPEGANLPALPSNLSVVLDRLLAPIAVIDKGPTP